MIFCERLSFFPVNIFTMLIYRSRIAGWINFWTSKKKITLIKPNFIIGKLTDQWEIGIWQSQALIGWLSYLSDMDIESGEVRIRFDENKNLIEILRSPVVSLIKSLYTIIKKQTCIAKIFWRKNITFPKKNVFRSRCSCQINVVSDFWWRECVLY